MKGVAYYPDIKGFRRLGVHQDTLPRQLDREGRFAEGCSAGMEFAG